MMDDLYTNIEEFRDDHNKWKRTTETSDSIYANEDTINLEWNRRGPALSGAAVVKKNKSSFRPAAVFLALLCCLLLIGLITVVVLFTRGRTNWEMEMVRFNNSYHNHTLTLTLELEDLQTTYNNLAEDRDRLQKGYDGVIQERNELRIKFQDRYFQQGWVYYRTSFYYVSTTKETWQKSREDCLKRGADLIIIDGKEEQDLSRKISRAIWIGLTDREVEGTWKWVDGTPLNRSYWIEGEPNNDNQGREENCAIFTERDMENNWNDGECGTLCNWICEKKLTL